ncbi:NUDIX hydrolase [Thaumasiovibrio sp. DFM-14]|uniref:NUDIX hydrolase n=1 Tax=Thaumasiovibrio sp. DFM-14 TaxID=3384792 RepID=UPI0039A2FDF3
MSKLHHQWKSFSLVEEPIAFPDGRQCYHTTLKHPGASVIMAQTKQGQFVLIRQFRPSLKRWIIELPAGTREGNESPLTCAKRELIEETGYSAQHWQHLGQIHPAPGFCDEALEIYLATTLSQTDTNFDDDELIEVLTLDLTTITAWIKAGKITDAKTICAFMLLGLHSR